MCPLCLATLVGTVAAAAASTALVGALAAKVLTSNSPEPKEEKGKDHAEDRDA